MGVDGSAPLRYSSSWPRPAGRYIVDDGASASSMDGTCVEDTAGVVAGGNVVVGTS